MSVIATTSPASSFRNETVIFSAAAKCQRPVLVGRRQLEDGPVRDIQRQPAHSGHDPEGGGLLVTEGGVVRTEMGRPVVRHRRRPAAQQYILGSWTPAGSW